MLSMFVCFAGIFAPVSKIKKAVDQTPSSVVSTPKTPRMDFSRVTGKNKKEKKDKDKEKGYFKHLEYAFFTQVICAFYTQRNYSFKLI